MRKTIATAALVLAAVLGIVAPASASAAGRAYNAGRACNAQGDFATCITSGGAFHPVKIYVHVTASPNQSVQVFWNMVCSKGSGAGGKSGQFTARTTIRRLIPHPYAHPTSCTIAADASLNRGGRVRAWLSYRR
jgi:hypothetical protein